MGFSTLPRKKPQQHHCSPGNGHRSIPCYSEVCSARCGSYGGKKTDFQMDSGESEEQDEEKIRIDETVVPDGSRTVRRSIEVMIDELRDLQNEMLSEQNLRGAAMLQQVIVRALNALNGSTVLDPGELEWLRTMAHDTFQILSRHMRSDGHAGLAGTYQRNALVYALVILDN